MILIIDKVEDLCNNDEGKQLSQELESTSSNQHLPTVTSDLETISISQPQLLTTEDEIEKTTSKYWFINN